MVATSLASALRTGNIGEAEVIPTGGTTARTLATLFAQIVDPKDYGAVGDGTTDDITAVQAATDALTAGGCVRFPPGTFVLGGKVIASGGYDIVFEGAGIDITTLKFTHASNGGIEYQGQWVTTAEQKREFFSVTDMTLLTSAAGAHTAIAALFKYRGSARYQQTNFARLSINATDVTDANHYWNKGILIENGWYGRIEHVNLNQSNNKRSGIGIHLDEFSIVTVIDSCNGHFWDKGIEIGISSAVGLTGTLSGTFTYAESVTGGTSGATGRVGNPTGGSAEDLLLFDTTGTFQDSEVVTGGTSGATLTLTQGPTAARLSSIEGVFLTNSNFIFGNYGYFSDQTSASGALAVQMNNNHFANHTGNIFMRWNSQVMILNCLMFPVTAGGQELDISGGEDYVIIGNTFGSTLASDIAVKLANIHEVVVTGNGFKNATIGIEIASDVKRGYFGGNSYRGNVTTLISNSGPLFPTADFNRFDTNPDGTALPRHLTASATLNFGAPGAVPGSVDLTITVTDATLQDTVTVGAPVAIGSDYILTAFVSAADTVTVRWTQLTGAAADPDGGGGTYQVDVWKH